MEGIFNADKEKEDVLFHINRDLQISTECSIQGTTVCLQSVFP